MTKEIINYDGTLSKEEIESWKEIEEPSLPIFGQEPYPHHPKCFS